MGAPCRESFGDASPATTSSTDSSFQRQSSQNSKSGLAAVLRFFGCRGSLADTDFGEQKYSVPVAAEKDKDFRKQTSSSRSLCSVASPKSIGSVASPKSIILNEKQEYSSFDSTARQSTNSIDTSTSSSPPKLSSPPVSTLNKVEGIVISSTAKVLYRSPNFEAAFPDHTWSLKDFSPQQLLHKGYAAVVVKARCLPSQQDVVLKCYQLSELDELTKYQVQREATLHASVMHANIVRLEVVFQDKDFLVMVLEHAAGGDLNQLTMKEGGRLSEATAMDKVIVPLLQTLQYLHTQGIVHRDIKPGNLLFTEDGSFKLCDFGVAINVEEESAVTCAGTRSYMAPEVQRCPPKLLPSDNKAREELHYGCEVDLWSVGVLTYRLLLGELPSELAKKTGAWVKQVQAAARSKQRSDTETLSPRPPQLPLVFPATPVLSEDAIDFIRMLLSGDPAARPTATEVLHHPWIQPAVSLLCTTTGLSSAYSVCSGWDAVLERTQSSRSNNCGTPGRGDCASAHQSLKLSGHNWPFISLADLDHNSSSQGDDVTRAEPNGLSTRFDVNDPLSSPRSPRHSRSLANISRNSSTDFTLKRGLSQSAVALSIHQNSQGSGSPLGGCRPVFGGNTALVETDFFRRGAISSVRTPSRHSLHSVPQSPSAQGPPSRTSSIRSIRSDAQEFLFPHLTRLRCSNDSNPSNARSSPLPKEYIIRSPTATQELKAVKSEVNCGSSLASPRNSHLDRSRSSHLHDHIRLV